jgi:YQGE family putative transporter
MCKDTKLLFIVSALFTLAMGISGVFVNVFFWKQTSDFSIIVIYNLTHYLTTPITFIVGGMIAKKKNGVWSLRIGLMLYAVFYALIAFLGDKAALQIYLVGILFGMATGFYWLAYNTLSFDLTNTKNRDTFNGLNGSIGGIVSAVTPITSAYIISRFGGFRGYRIVFVITLALFVALFLLSLILKCKTYGSKLDFKRCFSRNTVEWSIIRKATAIWGFRDVIIGFITTILIIQITNSELSLGTITLAASLISSASFWLVQKIIKPQGRRLSILIGSIGAFIAVLGLVMKVSFTTLIFYVGMDAFFLPFLAIQLYSSTFNVIDRSHEEDMRIEYMINKDFVLNLGRIISSLILLVLISIFKDSSILKAYLLLIGVVPLVSAYFLRRLTRILEGK